MIIGQYLTTPLFCFSLLNKNVFFCKLPFFSVILQCCYLYKRQMYKGSSFLKPYLTKYNL